LKRRAQKRRDAGQLDEGHAGKLEEMGRSFVFRLERTHAEAAAVVYALNGSCDFNALSDKFETVLHRGIWEAVQLLPVLPISRSDFDALSVLADGDDSSGSVGLCRKRLRAFWIILDADSSAGIFYRPHISDGLPPLH
jgi:hypothetical protein